MALEIPDEYVNFHLQFNLVNDPEPMNSAIGAWFGATVLEFGARVTQALATLTAMHEVFVPELEGLDYTVGPGFIEVGTPLGPVRVDGTGGVQACTGTDIATLPNNCAVLVKKSTATPGPKGRGRCYWPGINEGSVVANGVITGLAVTQWQAMADLIFGPLTDAGSEGLYAGPVVFHTNPAEAPSVVIAATVQQKIATQRTRMRP